MSATIARSAPVDAKSGSGRSGRPMTPSRSVVGPLGYRGMRPPLEGDPVAAARDGVVGRAKVPSWDEIMFGAGAAKKNDEDEFN